MAKVYKVVRHGLWNRTHPVSATAEYLHPELVTEYPLGQPVKPKIGRVFAFLELEDAREFKNHRTGCRVHEAQAGRVYPLTTNIVGNLTYLERIKEFWRGFFLDAWTPAPRGTVACDWIILGREVE